jgi:hypothetical protein
MTIVAVSLGTMRDGRRHGPLTKGWLHPRSQELRFRKRDGGEFKESWEPIWRERYDGDRETWVEAMSQDDLVTETFVIHPAVEFDAEERDSIQKLAAAKLAQIHEAHPTRSLSRCFDAVRPCEFRFPCAYFKEPTEGEGFVKIG